MAYIKQEMEHSQVLLVKVTKVTLHGNQATALVAETNKLTYEPPTAELRMRQDLWVKTRSGWRIGHIHASGNGMMITY